MNGVEEENFYGGIEWFVAALIEKMVALTTSMPSGPGKCDWFGTCL